MRKNKTITQTPHSLWVVTDQIGNAQRAEWVCVATYAKAQDAISDAKRFEKAGLDVRVDFEDIEHSRLFIPGIGESETRRPRTLLQGRLRTLWGENEDVEEGDVEALWPEYLQSLPDFSRTRSLDFTISVWNDKGQYWEPVSEHMFFQEALDAKDRLTGRGREVLLGKPGWDASGKELTRVYSKYERAELDKAVKRRDRPGCGP